MKHIGLFEGIGGFSLAARWAGWETIAWCEWNDFGQKILKHHFPNAQGHGDITKTDFTIYKGQCDIVTGGFPCQPYSMAGKRKGKDDERHLWPEMLRAIKEIQPSWVVGENVYGLVNWSGGLVFHEVQSDLEAEGYEVWPFLLPAAAVNAPHRRDRVWFVAYAKSMGRRRRGCKTSDKWQNIIQQPGSEGFGSCRTTPHPNGNGLNGSDCEYEVNASEGGEYAQRNTQQNDTKHTTSIGQEYALENRELEGRRFRQPNKRNMWHSFPSVSPICTGDDGLSSRLDGITFSKWRNQSIMAAGNAIVPQVAYQIFKTINQYIKCNQTI